PTCVTVRTATLGRLRHALVQPRLDAVPGQQRRAVHVVEVRRLHEDLTLRTTGCHRTTYLDLSTALLPMATDRAEWRTCSPPTSTTNVPGETSRCSRTHLGTKSSGSRSDSTTTSGEAVWPNERLV